MYNFARLAVPDLLDRVVLAEATSYNELSAWRHPKFFRGASRTVLASMSPRPSKVSLITKLSSGLENLHLPKNSQGTSKGLRRRGSVKSSKNR